MALAGDQIQQECGYCAGRDEVPLLLLARQVIHNQVLEDLHSILDIGIGQEIER